MFNFKNKKMQAKEILVHRGDMHSDDIASVAACFIALGREIPVRRADPTESDFQKAKEGELLILDVGRIYNPEIGVIDHHQDESPRYSDGSKKATFGLIMGLTTLTEEPYWQEIEAFVKTFDAHDNGGEAIEAAELLGGNFSPTWEEDESLQQERFMEAVRVWRSVLLAKLRWIKAEYNATGIIQEALDKAVGSTVVVLEQDCPWQKRIVPEEDKLVVVAPSNRGGYGIQIVNKHLGTRDLRGAFPADVKTMAGVTFVHASGFYASAETLPEAIAVAKAVRRV